MTHVDDSLALTAPTSEFSAGTVGFDDRPNLTGVDCMEFFFPIIQMFCQRDLNSPTGTELAHVKLIPSNF